MFFLENINPTAPTITSKLLKTKGWLCSAKPQWKERQSYLETVVDRTIGQVKITIWSLNNVVFGFCNFGTGKPEFPDSIAK
jgi:hypothetical protein